MLILPPIIPNLITTRKPNLRLATRNSTPASPSGSRRAYKIQQISGIDDDINDLESEMNEHQRSGERCLEADEIPGYGTGEGEYVEYGDAEGEGKGCFVD